MGAESVDPITDHDWIERLSGKDYDPNDEEE